MLVVSVSEGHACRARRSAMDNSRLLGGPDKQVPPRVAEVQPPLHPPARGGNVFFLPACGEGRGGAGPLEGHACRARSEGRACHAR